MKSKILHFLLILFMTQSVFAMPTNRCFVEFENTRNTSTTESYLIAENIPLNLPLSEISQAIFHDSLPDQVNPSQEHSCSHLVIEKKRFKIGNYFLSIYQPSLKAGATSSLKPKKKMSFMV